ncbi:MAG: caspase family protein [Pseudomonadota bacterium]
MTAASDEVPNPYHYAVVVGIDSYPSQKPLKGARVDARQFAKWLRQPENGGLKRENVGLVVDPSKKDKPQTDRESAVPTRMRIYKEIRKFVERAKQAVDADPTVWDSTRLYVFLAGHGIAHGRENVALLMANVGDEYRSENLSTGRIIDILKLRQDFAEVVIIADCCRDRPLATAFPPLDLDPRVGQNGEVKWSVFMGSEFERRAFEAVPEGADPNDPNLFRGHFTKAVLEGLRGGFIDGPVNIGTLKQFVRERLRKQLEGRGYDQRARLFGYEASEIVLRQSATGSNDSPAPANVEIVLEVLAPFVGDVAVHGGENVQITQFRVTDDRRRHRVLANVGINRVVAVGEIDHRFQADGFFIALVDDEHVRI